MVKSNIDVSDITANTLMEEISQATGKNEFEIVSGRLLVADPFGLGYPKHILEKLTKNSGLRTYDNPIVSFPHGILYDTLTYYDSKEENHIKTRICGTDCAAGVYREREAIKIVRIDDQPRKLKEPLLSASVDLCCLLIGDAEKYSLPESDWKFADNPHISPEQNKSHEEFRRELTRGIYKEQVLQIPNGRYTAHHVLQKTTFVLKLLRKK